MLTFELMDFKLCILSSCRRLTPPYRSQRFIKWVKRFSNSSSDKSTAEPLKSDQRLYCVLTQSGAIHNAIIPQDLILRGLKPTINFSSVLGRGLKTHYMYFQFRHRKAPCVFQCFLIPPSTMRLLFLCCHNIIIFIQFNIVWELI